MNDKLFWMPLNSIGEICDPKRIINIAEENNNCDYLVRTIKKNQLLRLKIILIPFMALLFSLIYVSFRYWGVSGYCSYVLVPGSIFITFLLSLILLVYKKSDDYISKLKKHNAIKYRYLLIKKRNLIYLSVASIFIIKSLLLSQHIIYSVIALSLSVVFIFTPLYIINKKLNDFKSSSKITGIINIINPQYFNRFGEK